MAISAWALTAARKAIASDNVLIYDVAANCGQIVGNVKHMTWFVRAVAEWLEDEAQ